MSSGTHIDPLRLMSAFWQLRQMLAGRLGKRVAAEIGLEVKDGFVMMSIDRGMAYPSDLAEHMMLPTYAVSRSLEGLIAAGLVERQFDESDARRTRLSLTKKGQQKLAEVMKIWRAEVGSLLGQLPHEHQEQLVQHMETLAQLSREPQES